MPTEPAASLIISTCTYRAALQRTLKAISAQAYPLHKLELLVLTDVSLEEMAGDYCPPFPLHIIEQVQGISQNQVAAQARGKILIFLDADIEPVPSLVAAHVLAHTAQPGGVVIGPTLLAAQHPSDFLHLELRTRRGNAFEQMGRPWHRFTYQDLQESNFSLAAELFSRVGGYHTTIDANRELGFRLIKAHLPFTYAHKALGYRHYRAELSTFLEQRYHLGRANVELARRCPKLWPVLPLNVDQAGSVVNRMMRHLAFSRPATGDKMAVRQQELLHGLERLNWPARWRRHFKGLQGYWYWRGVAHQIGSRGSLAELLGYQNNGDYHHITVDIEKGLPAAEQRIDAERPEAVEIYYGPHYVGHIPHQPGAERLRGAHLRPFIAQNRVWDWLRAVGLQNIGSPSVGLDPLLVRFLQQNN